MKQFNPKMEQFYNFEDAEGRSFVLETRQRQLKNAEAVHVKVPVSTSFSVVCSCSHFAVKAKVLRKKRLSQEFELVYRTESWSNCVYLRTAYCKVLTCCICRKTGPHHPSYVDQRFDVWSWTQENQSDYEYEKLIDLCFGCWNKARAIKKKKENLKQAKYFLSKIKDKIRSSKNEQAKNNQDNRSIQTVSC